MIPREHETAEYHIGRRTILLATAGFIGLAGCSSDGSNDDGENEGDGTQDTQTTTGDSIEAPEEGETTDTQDQDTQTRDTNTPDGQADDTSTRDTDCVNPGACPMLPGSSARFDPGASPLPVSFEYPSAMSDDIKPISTSASISVLGQISRCGEAGFNGDIQLGIDVRYGARTRNERDDWYANNKQQGRETFATTEISGEPVEFLADSDGASDTASPGAAALIPYDGETGTTYHLMEVGVEILLATADVESPTESCADNLRATLERTVESLEANEATTFEQNFDF